MAGRPDANREGHRFDPIAIGTDIRHQKEKESSQKDLVYNLLKQGNSKDY